jgi:hypothetical protein
MKSNSTEQNSNNKFKQTSNCYRTDTASIEFALEKLIQAQTTKVNIRLKPLFLINILKEIIARRDEEDLIFNTIKDLFTNEEIAILRKLK